MFPTISTNEQVEATMMKRIRIYMIITGFVGVLYFWYSSPSLSYVYQEQDKNLSKEQGKHLYVKQNTNLYKEQNIIKKNLKIIEPYKQQSSLITMFTSWTTSPERFKVYTNTIRNWPLLNIILFTNDKIHEKYKRLGWTVLPVRRHVKGHSILKDMFIEVIQLQPDSNLYGFANGDILFTDSFIKSVSEISKSPLVVNRTYMVVGRRLDTPNVTLEEASSWKNLTRAANRGKLMGELLGIDYFITPPSYHWKDIPDVQIGQKLYDNWLVRDARKMSHVVIDSAKTLLAVNQNAPYPKHHGKMNQNHEYFNEPYHTIYKQGVIACCRYRTFYNNDTIKIRRRKQLRRQCTL